MACPYPPGCPVGLLWQLGELSPIKHLERCLGSSQACREAGRWSPWGSVRLVSEQPSAQRHAANSCHSQGAASLPGAGATSRAVLS